MRQRAFHIAPGTENQIPITPTLYTANPQVRRCQFNTAIFLSNLKIDLSSAEQFLFVLAGKSLPWPVYYLGRTSIKIASRKVLGKKIIDLISHLWAEGSKFLVYLISKA